VSRVLCCLSTLPTLRSQAAARVSSRRDRGSRFARFASTAYPVSQLSRSCACRDGHGPSLCWFLSLNQSDFHHRAPLVLRSCLHAAGFAQCIGGHPACNHHLSFACPNAPRQPHGTRRSSQQIKREQAAEQAHMRLARGGTGGSNHIVVLFACLFVTLVNARQCSVRRIISGQPG